MKTNFKNSYRYFIRHLREKHRFSIRNQHTDTEVWYIYISPLNVLAGLLALVLVLFIIVTTTVAYTPILDFIPGYPGNKSRTMLIENIMRLDSLEKEIKNMQIYNENVALIMAGKKSGHAQRHADRGFGLPQQESDGRRHHRRLDPAQPDGESGKRLQH